MKKLPESVINAIPTAAMPTAEVESAGRHRIRGDIDADKAR
jgi:hypothetical protein